MVRIDTDKLLKDSNIINVIGKHLSLTKRNSEYYGICPFHADTKESLQVNEKKQIFKCFACGEGGDSIEFLSKMGRTFKEACEEIAGADLGGTNPVQNAPRPSSVVEWKQLVSTELPTNEETRHYRNGYPVKTWAYHDQDGNVVGVVCRFDTPEGKQVLPLTYRTDGNRIEWRWQGFDAPRTLFNLDRIVSAPSNLSIVVVEGEKTAEAAQRLLEGKAIVTTWIGGARAIMKTDWTPLKGRKVILWPDNDAPGVEAMQEIDGVIRETALVTRWVKNPSEAPEKWDVADANWTPEETFTFVKNNLHDFNPYNEPEVDYEMPPPLIQEHEYEIPPLPLDLPELKGNGYEQHFRMLGFDKSEANVHRYFFYSYRSKTLQTYTAPQLTKANLIQLAPVNYWEMAFPAKSGWSDGAASNWLVDSQQRIGFFKSDFVRGRGAWVDNGRMVLHSGDRLLADGETYEIGQFDSRYIYEQAEPLGISADRLVTNQESSKLLNLTRKLNWEREIDGYLLAGWCIVAPICGALSWRPHIWLTGAAGTGKTWVFDKFVRRLLGKSALYAQGETSEAGLRQTLGHDAMPVVFDEAEGNEKRDQDRIQQILSLMRQASAEDGGLLIKGSSGGTSKSYRVRSCFAFASIAVQLAQQADRTRVTVLSLTEQKGPDAGERFAELQREYESLMTDDFVRGIHGRTLKYANTIIANAKMFSRAAADVIGRQRTGDQLGALLAGAYSLVSTKLVSYEEALEFVNSKDWSEERGLDKTRDEIALLSHIMEQITRIETSEGTKERTIGELVRIAAKRAHDFAITHDMANERIRRLGIKVQDECLTISNSADPLKQILKHTPWSKNWNKILLRADGAYGVDSTRFGSGMMSRGVSLPLDIMGK